MEKSVESKKIFIVVGMAGSGKTLFCQRLYSWISESNFTLDRDTGLNKEIFSINLDPAILTVKMPLNEDIREVIDYNKTMEDYNLGPNGAITTCLNLYLLKINELIPKINSNFVIIDTPGQIEAFTWSSPGHVLIESLKTLPGYDVVLLYLIDSFSSQSPCVFMSNMIYSASLMAKFRVRTIAVFNKTDIIGTDNLTLWIEDYEEFQKSFNGELMTQPIYNSMVLYFEEFYRKIETVAVSAKIGMGKDGFFAKFK